MKPIPPTSDRIRTPIVVALVAAIHLLAFGGFSLLQGCATRAPRTGSNASTAIASSRGASRAPVEEVAPAPRVPAAAPAAPAAATRAPAPRVPADTGVVAMPPRLADRAATPAASASSSTPATPAASSGLKSFTPPPFVPAPGAVKTPAAPRTPAATATAAAGTQKYVVQSGESLSLIAQKHGVKTRDLMELNGLSDANKVRVGQPLLVPANAKTPAGAVKASAEAAPASVKTPAPAATPLVNGPGGGTHKVKPGDALSKIAKQYGTTTAELRKLNNLSSDSIRVDQTLKLPGASAAAAPSASPSVAVLDVGTKVPALAPAAPAGTKKVSPSEIESILGPDPARRAATGTTTRIEEVLEAESPDQPAVPARDTTGLGGITLKPTEYKILPGDTVGKLAVIFLSSEAEIRRLNGLGPSQEVKAGDTILIPPPKDP